MSPIRHDPVTRRGTKHIRVPDWLPALVNAGRAFVTIGAVALFWIVTAWPGGGGAIMFATIIVLLLAPRADQAYGAAILFIVGIIVDVVLTAIVAFGVLPELGIERFAGFSLVLAVCLVPMGALLAQARQAWQVGLFTGITMLFMPLLQPSNPMTYNPEAFYNASSTIVFGAGFAALSFRLLPPLSPAFRTRRLLALTLRDLRRLALGRSQRDWEGLVYGRLSAMPDEATPLQRAQLVAALSVGSEIVHLRHIAHDLSLGPKLDPALAALADGHSARAIARLTRLDEVLATDAADGPGMQPSCGHGPTFLSLRRRWQNTAPISMPEHDHEIRRDKSVRRVRCADIDHADRRLDGHNRAAPGCRAPRAGCALCGTRCCSCSRFTRSSCRRSF